MFEKGSAFRSPQRIDATNDPCATSSNRCFTRVRVVTVSILEVFLLVNVRTELKTRKSLLHCHHILQLLVSKPSRWAETCIPELFAVFLELEAFHCSVLVWPDSQLK